MTLNFQSTILQGQMHNSVPLLQWLRGDVGVPQPVSAQRNQHNLVFVGTYDNECYNKDAFNKKRNEFLLLYVKMSGIVIFLFWPTYEKIK